MASLVKNGLPWLEKGDIILYTIEGWGHKWPKIGEAGIDATDLIWNFLKVQNRTIQTSIEKNDKHFLPAAFKLYQNYPNPFNPLTRIKYRLTRSDHIMLKIYNLAG